MAPGPAWIPDFQARADLEDTFNIIIGLKSLSDIYDIRAGLALTDTYTILIGSSLVDVYDIERAVFKNLVDIYRIAVGPVSIEESYDIQVAKA